MTPHPHADILNALADGLPIERVQYRKSILSSGCWYFLDQLCQSAPWHFLCGKTDTFEFRIAPLTRRIGEWEVPAPVGADFQGHRIWLVYLATGEPHFKCRGSTGTQDWTNLLKSGLAFATESDALQNARALAGKNPMGSE